MVSYSIGFFRSQPSHFKNLANSVLPNLSCLLLLIVSEHAGLPSTLLELS